MTVIEIHEETIAIYRESISNIATGRRVDGMAQMRNDKAWIVANLVLPQIKLLMDKSESELMQMHLDMMKGCVACPN